MEMPTVIGDPARGGKQRKGYEWAKSSAGIALGLHGVCHWYNRYVT
jgi:hypothetical protein